MIARSFHTMAADPEFAAAPSPGISAKGKWSNLLWTLQVLLASLFLFAGGMKLVIAPDVLMAMGSPDQVRLPGLFVEFIGVVEVLGGLGLILPGLLRIWTFLTPMAAAGLAVIMVGATGMTLVSGDAAGSGVPLMTGALAASVGYARWRVLPLRQRNHMNSTFKEQA